MLKPPLPRDPLSYPQIAEPEAPGAPDDAEDQRRSGIDVAADVDARGQGVQGSLRIT